MQDANRIESAIAEITGHIDELHAKAYVMVDTHWEWVRKMEAKIKGAKSSSQLAPRCARKEGSNSIGLTWSRMKYVRGSQGKGGQTIYNYIRRPEDSFSYSLPGLRRWARDWEVEAVEALERQMTHIRRESAHCNKALASLRYALEAIRRRVADEEGEISAAAC